jgi:hypothetical protein
MMMMKSLVAVDGSDHENRAIDAVGRRAWLSLDMEAALICVSPEPMFYRDYTATAIQNVEAEQKLQQNITLTTDAVVVP